MVQVASPTNAAMAARLERDVSNLQGELTIAKRKLSSKAEALIILSADLDACRTDRDQYKLMAEQLQARHVAIKKQLAGAVDEGRSGGDLDVDQLWRLLAEHQAKSKAVALEAEDLKQRLAEAEGDNRALREQLGRHRMGEDDEAVSRRSWSASEREALVATLEEERKKNENLKRDMREVFDQKEELVVERDALQTKHERLNKEMNLMLRGDPERILDLDALTMENAYLKQELTRTKEEQNKAAATLTKYRGLLEKRMAKVMGGGKAILDDLSAPSPVAASSNATAAAASNGLPPSVEALGRKLVKVPPDRASPQVVAHLQKFIVFLQETLQDRSVAIVHQRKTNQILGRKVQALENRLRHRDPVSENVRSRELSHSNQNDETFVSDSLETCRVSDRCGDGSDTQLSSSFPRPSLADAEDGTKEIVSSQNGDTDSETTDVANDVETLSVADSFCDFQSVDDHRDFPFVDDASLSTCNGISHRTNHLSQSAFSELQLGECDSAIAGSNIPANGDETPSNSVRNLGDLLSWEFDDRVEKDDGNQSPAILAPTVLN